MDILTWPLSQTVTDISSLAGIVGFVVTVKLFYDAFMTEGHSQKQGSNT